MKDYFLMLVVAAVVLLGDYVTEETVAPFAEVSDGR